MLNSFVEMQFSKNTQKNAYKCRGGMHIYIGWGSNNMYKIIILINSSIHADQIDQIQCTN